MSNLKNPPKPVQHEHPSYGMIGISRLSHGHGTRLFGSALADHVGTMRVSIVRAVREHDLHQDRYFAREELIEVEMSAAQFAEMLTTPNVGSGVPCTVRRVGRERMPDPPDVETEVERVRVNFSDDLQDMVTAMKQRRESIEALAIKLGPKVKERLRIELDVMIQQLESNVPFILEQFNRASDRVVSAAKQEIEAFATHVVRSAGLEAVAAGQLPKMLAGSRDPVTDPDNNT